MKKLVPLFLLVLLFITGCDLSGLTVTTTSQQPVVNSFSASPSSISVGESSTLNWTVTGATTVSIDQGIGNVALTGPRAVTPAATTVYTLTASSAAGSVTATTQVIVSGVSSPPESTPSSSDIPVVNYFAANPSVITAGGSTTLGWDVSNATSVTIDNGVGAVGSNGSTLVSPAMSTNYTLTAANAAGSFYMTVTVLVTGAPAAGQADLIIEDISRSSDKISYKIKNQGDSTAGPSTTTLRVDGSVAANDSVGSLAAGESKTETFAGYTYSCTLPSDALISSADSGNAVVESSESNNSYTESWTCLILGPVRTFTLKPDLVITDIWIDGHTIRYRIKNQGTGASTAGYSRLFIEGVYIENDYVSAIAGGDSLPRSFSYNFDCALPILKEVKVYADYAGDSTETDETNNARTETFACP